MTWLDYAVIGVRLQIVGETLCEAVDLRGGQRVLDVAAGNGNATLAAARRYADVVSTDYVGALLARGRERAEAERLPVTFQVADAENLPFDDDSFDAVLSTFGVMFTPNQQQAANSDDDGGISLIVVAGALGVVVVLLLGAAAGLTYQSKRKSSGP